MKESTVPTIKILSKRAQEFLNTSRHLKENSSQAVLSARPFWEFSFQKNNENEFQSDKILTLFYSYPTATELEFLFMETISRLATGRNILFLEKLTFRELENFLRDENHLPVFEISITPEVEALYKVVKFSLLASILIKEIENNIDYRPLEKSWSALSFVEKNREAKILISLLNSLFPAVKPLELALVENQEISVVMNEFPISQEVIEEVLGRLFVNPLEKSSLKVVAVQ